MKILGIPGSLRKGSSSMIVLKKLGELFPDDCAFSIFQDLHQLPHFDGKDEPSAEVIRWREALKQADALVICSPEYAFGVPGTLKNALDWTVSSGEFVEKPTALIVASTSGEHAFASLKLILTALSATTSEETNLLIPFIRSKIFEEHLVDKEALIALKTIAEKLSGIGPKK